MRINGFSTTKRNHLSCGGGGGSQELSQESTLLNNNIIEVQKKPRRDFYNSSDLSESTRFVQVFEDQEIRQEVAGVIQEIEMEAPLAVALSQSMDSVNTATGEEEVSPLII